MTMAQISHKGSAPLSDPFFDIPPLGTFLGAQLTNTRTPENSLRPICCGVVCRQGSGVLQWIWEQFFGS